MNTAADSREVTDGVRRALGREPADFTQYAERTATATTLNTAA